MDLEPLVTARGLTVWVVITVIGLLAATWLAWLIWKRDQRRAAERRQADRERLYRQMESYRKQPPSDPGPP